MASFKEMLETEKPVLIDFFAEWCGPCKMMPPILDELKQRMGDKIVILKVNVDKNQKFAAQHMVQSVPTLLIYKDGQEQWRQSGVAQAGDLERQLEKFL